MFFVVTLAKRLYSLLFLPSFLLLLSSRARARTTRVLFFCCHKCHSRWSWQHFLIPKNNVSFCRKQRVILLKTTCRFVENNVSFYWKQRVVLCRIKTDCFSPLWHLWQQKDENSCTACARESLSEKWRWNAKQCCTKVSKLFWGELPQKKVTLLGLDKHYAFYCCSQTYLIAKTSIY